MSEAKKETKWITGHLYVDGGQRLYHIEVPINTGKRDVQLIIEHAYKLYHPDPENEIIKTSEIKNDTKWINGRLYIDGGGEFVYYSELPANTDKHNIQLLIERLYKLYHPDQC